MTRSKITSGGGRDGYKRISSFWWSKDKKTNTISLIEILCVKSFIDNGHEFNLYSYSNLDEDESLKFLVNGIKDSENFHLFKILDANDIVHKSKIFLDDEGCGISAFSDYFRYNILYKKGGIWVDMDVVCLKSLNDLPENFFVQERSSFKKCICATCVMGASANSEYIANIIKNIEIEIKKQLKYKVIDVLYWMLFPIVKFKTYKKKVRWGCIGPKFLTEYISNNKDVINETKILGPHYFCDNDHWLYDKVFYRDGYVSSNKNYGLHLWNLKFVVNDINLLDFIEKDSFIYRQLLKYTLLKQ